MSRVLTPSSAPKLDLTPDERRVADRIRPHLFRGCRVVVGDGAGAPVGLGRPLAHAARQVGGVSLVLGWCFELPVPLDFVAFPEIRTIVGGYGLRGRFADGHVRYLPLRLSTVPALLQSTLRPDVAVLGLRDDLRFGSEVSWMRAAAEAAPIVLAEVNHGLPAGARDPALPAGKVVVAHETQRPPLTLPEPRRDETSRRIGHHVAELVPSGASVQFGPGTIGDAALRALEHPVRVDSGVVTDAVVDLHTRGLLLGDPVAAYLVGSGRVHEWAHERPVTARIEYTHDLTRLTRLPLMAVNTALEIDTVGQINVEGFGPDVVAGVGGHPDYAAAAARSARGLSIIALPTHRRGRPTLVERLSAPASTSRSDIDVVVTEHGTADLRGRSDQERAGALRALWDDAAATTS